MLCKPLSRTPLKAVFTVAVAMFLIGAAQAQVVMVDKPYRQQPAPGAAIDLPIAPYAAPAPATTPVSQVAPVVAAQAAPIATAPAKRWEVLPSDQTLSRALARWAREENLQFFWEAPRDLLAVRASYTGSFEAAVQGVMVDSPKSGYPLHACQYENSVRVLHTSQPCTH